MVGGRYDQEEVSGMSPELPVGKGEEHGNGWGWEVGTCRDMAGSPHAGASQLCTLSASGILVGSEVLKMRTQGKPKMSHRRSKMYFCSVSMRRPTTYWAFAISQAGCQVLYRIIISTSQQVLTSPFYRWENWGSARYVMYPKSHSMWVTKPRIWTPSSSSWSQGYPKFLALNRSMCVLGALRQWRICWQFGRPGFNPWVGKFPWRRKW